MILEGFAQCKTLQQSVPQTFQPPLILSHMPQNVAPNPSVVVPSSGSTYLVQGLVLALISVIVIIIVLFSHSSSSRVVLVVLLVIMAKYEQKHEHEYE